MNYTGPNVPPGPGAVTSAQNGLSLDPSDPSIVVLGQDLGAVGNPAIFLNDRELPTAGFNLVLTGTGNILSDGDIGLGDIANPAAFMQIGGPSLGIDVISNIWEPNNYGTVYPLAGEADRFYAGWHRFDGVNADGRPNVVGAFWTYNVQMNGGRFNTNEAGFRFGTETHFDLSHGPSFEFHLPEMVIQSGASFRPHSMYIDKITGFSQWVCNNSSYDFFTNIFTSDAGLSLDALKCNLVFSLDLGPGANHANHVTVSNSANLNQVQLTIEDFGVSFSQVAANTASARYEFDAGIEADVDFTARQGLQWGIRLNMFNPVAMGGNGDGYLLDQGGVSNGTFNPINLHVNAANALITMDNAFNNAGSGTYLALKAEHGKVIHRFSGTTNFADVIFDGNAASKFTWQYNSATFMTFDTVGSIGMRSITSPTAQIMTAPGTAAANDGQLKLSTDSALKTTPEDGLFEFDGTLLYFTVAGVRKTVTLI